MKKERLGKILLEMGSIDELQLQAALAYQRQWGMPLRRALIENRLCSGNQVMQALAKQIGLPFIDVDSREEQTPEPGPVLLYGWTDQAGSTLGALLLSQSMTSTAVGAAAVLSCSPTDVVIAPLAAIEELLASKKKIPGRVLVVSKTPSSEMGRARKTGAWGMLSPPIDARRLAATIQRCREAPGFLWAT